MELATIFAFEKSIPGPEQELVAKDQLRTSLNQLKPATMLQNIPNQHMLFFLTGLGHVHTAAKFGC